MYDNYDDATYAKRERARPVSKSLFVFLTLFTLWWMLLLFFNRFPGIDLSVAQYAFTATPCPGVSPAGKICGAFDLARNPLFEIARGITLALPYIAIAVLITTLVSSWRKYGIGLRSVVTDRSIAALLSLAVGCGLIVNTLLKGHSGRPRPRSTDLFGGGLDFVQAGSFAGKCLGNCSFVSGEASSGGWLLCLVLLLPPRLRLRLGIPLALISVLMPIMRVLTGAHYLSDAVLGWLLSLVIFAGAMALLDFMQSRSPACT